MHIPLAKGKRREVRRELAQQSKNLLLAYRNGNEVNKDTCPLARALHRAQELQHTVEERKQALSRYS
jgi:hypothetical protein